MSIGARIAGRIRHLCAAPGAPGSVVVTSAAMTCLIFDDEGAVLSTGRYCVSTTPEVGTVLQVGLDDPQPLVEHRVQTPERPLHLLLAEGQLVAGHVERVSFNLSDGCTCRLRVVECRQTSATPAPV